jgi:DNA-binding Lrp family transcriptional regulator
MKLSQFLASVNIFVDQSQKNNVISELSKIQNAKEVYEVAGEYDIVSLISAANLEEFRDVLQKRVMKIKGVKSTITTIILCRYKERITGETENGEGPHST